MGAHSTVLKLSRAPVSWQLVPPLVKLTAVLHKQWRGTENLADHLWQEDTTDI